MNTVETLSDKLACVNTNQKTEYLLEKYPITRDDSDELFFAYLVEFHDLENKVGADSFKIFKELLTSKQCLSSGMLIKSKSFIQGQGKYWGETKKAQEKIKDMRDKINNKQDAHEN